MPGGTSGESHGRDERVDEALADYLRRVDAGEQIDSEHFIRQHPDVADELRAFFADILAVRGALGAADSLVPRRLIPSHEPQRGPDPDEAFKAPAKRSLGHASVEYSGNLTGPPAASPFSATSVTVEHVLAFMIEGGLLSPRESKAFAERFSVKSDSTTAEQLVGELRRSGKLTDFQWKALQQGRGAELILDNYVLLDRLGQGGMGTVYKARHTTLHRTMAIKTLAKRLMADQASAARFEREMEAIGALSHPHIVRAAHAGQMRGTLFLVMEYVEGRDLNEVSRRCGPLRTPDACELVRQAALGLQHIHDHGLVHRDIKPSNLILTTQGAVKVLDLGLASLRRRESGEDRLTATGQAIGTVDYMAPEQIEDSHRIDIRADIYSLGCTLYKLLAARPPFSAEDYPEVFNRLIARLDQPAPPITTYREHLPSELVAVVHRMLSRDPTDRFMEPVEVARVMEAHTEGCDLRRVLETADGKVEASPVVVAGEPGGQAIVAASVNQPLKATVKPKFTHLRPLPIVAIAGSALAAATVAVVCILSLDTDGRHGSDSTVATLQMGGVGQTPPSNRLPGEYNVSPPEANARTPADRDPYEAALAVVDALTRDPPDMERYCMELSTAVSQLQRQDDILAIAKELSERASDKPEYRRMASGWLCAVADDLLPEWHRESMSDTDLASLVEILNTAIQLDPQAAKAYRLRAAVRCWKSELNAAIADATVAIQINPQDAVAHYWRAAANVRLNNLDQTIRDCTDAVRLDPRLNPAYHNRAAAYLAKGETDKALADLSEAIKIGPSWAGHYRLRGWVWSEKGEYDKAIADFSEAVRLRPSDAELYYWRGVSHAKKGDWNLAIADYSEAIRFRPDWASPRLGRALARARLGQLESSREDIGIAVQANPDTAANCNAIACLLVISREPAPRDSAKAVELATKAVELAPGEWSYWNTLGAAQYRAGDWQAAIDSLEKSSEIRGGFTIGWFFLAMAHHQLGHQEEARRWYDTGLKWMDENRSEDEELLRIRIEVEELLRTSDPNVPARPSGEP